MVPGPVEGPSPRGRGNRSSFSGAPSGRRSIPAWAGKPGSGRFLRGDAKVHPRVGGETRPRSRPPLEIGGPSPRGRGNRGHSAPDVRDGGSIPAWAGKPTICSSRCSPKSVHPRVGGETRCRPEMPTREKGPSPRGRGNRRRRERESKLGRSIPAWAGKPPTRSTSGTRIEVHPRVGGETLSFRSAIHLQAGPSPRGRGNLRGVSKLEDPVRSIPAWAGKPAPAGPILT